MGGGLQRDEGFIARMGPSQSISTWPELPAGRVPPTPNRTPCTPPAHAVRCPSRPTPVPSPCTTMAGRCRQCSQPTEWAPDVGSDVCTSCGTLADPSQSVLTSHIDFPNDASTRDYPSLPYTRPTALKSLRGTAGWLLAGQGKEATHDRNKVRSPPARCVLVPHPVLPRRSPSTSPSAPSPPASPTPASPPARRPSSTSPSTAPPSAGAAPQSSQPAQPSSSPSARPAAPMPPLTSP